MKMDAGIKFLEDYNDVFSDIVNVLIYGGREIVTEEMLENSKDRSYYRTSGGRLTQQERDCVKWWKTEKVRIALFGLENQSYIDKGMCFRLFGYDGAAYRSQYSEKDRYPVITLVLYFGYEKHWDDSCKLSDHLQISEELQPFFNEYEMNLFEIAWLEDEQIAGFKSDFKIVADYFVQMRKNKDYVPGREVIRHVDAVLKMMSELTGDNRFEVVQNDFETGEEITMCEVLDRVEERGVKRGIEQGIEQGRKQGIEQGIVQGRKQGIEQGIVQGRKQGEALYMRRIVEQYAQKHEISPLEACEIIGIPFSEYQSACKLI